MAIAWRSGTTSCASSPTIAEAAESAVAEVDEALDLGEPLVAFDRAQAALERHAAPHLVLEHRLVLALARSGAMRTAGEELERRRLIERSADAPDRLREDIRALPARLAKDRALRAVDAERRAWAATAAERYDLAGVEETTAYPIVNSATMRLLAGDVSGAHERARRALEVLGRTGVDDYWTPATEAEAWLVLGDLVRAEAALDRAALAGASVAMLGATRRQFSVLSQATSVGDSLLSHLVVPSVAHFAGHRLTGLDDRAEARLRARIVEALDAHGVGRAYGSLAAGADLMIVETILDRGGEVRALVPFDRDEFVERAVRPAGDDWVARFEAVARRLDADGSLHQVVDGPYRGDDCLYGYVSRLAMGEAVIRARSLVLDPVQIAVWDGDEGNGVAGTGVDVARWRSAGHHVHRIDPVGDRVRGGSVSAPDPPRRILTALFGDVKGFSRLGDDRLPTFFATVMGSLGAVLDRAGDDVLYRNTWGDGLYVVVSSAPAAARLAFALQQAVDDIDRVAADLPDDLRLRIGGHAGPLFEGYDQVRREPTWFGRAVTTAARIEPRTPEGEVYVTGAFASLLALEGDGTIVPEYVGHVPTAKGYGELPMYVLVGR